MRTGLVSLRPLSEASELRSGMETMRRSTFSVGSTPQAHPAKPGLPLLRRARLRRRTCSSVWTDSSCSCSHCRRDCGRGRASGGGAGIRHREVSSATRPEDPCGGRAHRPHARALFSFARAASSTRREISSSWQELPTCHQAGAPVAPASRRDRLLYVLEHLDEIHNVELLLGVGQLDRVRLSTLYLERPRVFLDILEGPLWT